MRKSGKKILSLLLTLVLLVGVLPGMSLTALAETEQSETIATTAKTVNGNHFTISSYFAHETYGMIAYKGLGGITVTPKNNEYITKVVITCDWQPGFVNNNNTTVSSGTKTITDGGGTITVTDVNASTFNFKCDSSTPCFNPFVVYYLDSAPVPVTNITLDKTSAALTVDGEAVALTATVSPDGATDKTVKWSVGGTNASAVTLYSDADCKNAVQLNTATETLTVYARGMSAGTATVKVESNADSNKSASCNVTVKPNGFTVTYAPGLGSGQIIEDGPHEEGAYVIQAYDQRFTAPEGKVFDYWQGSDGGKYRDGQTIQLTADLTLTAQWKDASQGDGSGGGSGSGGDIVFSIPGADNSWEYVGGGYAPQQAYRVSFAPMQGGSAALGLTTGESGETMNVYPQTTVRVLPTPEPGYRLASIVWSMIDGSASYDITEAQTFVMPAMDVVVYVTFQPAA